jgi:hypothetical protein
MSTEFKWTDEIAEEYAKWCMNREHRGWGNLNSFKKLYQSQPQKYTQEQLDKMREDAFNAARATKLSIDGFDVAYKYSTAEDYKQSKQ